MPVFPADDRRMIEPVHDVFTPHMSLVPHLPGGSVRVLASANYDSGHWPLELKQHLDMELTAVYTRSRTPFGFPSGWSGMRAADVTVRLLQALFRHFAVKISETKFTVLPEVVHAPPQGAYRGWRRLCRLSGQAGLPGYTPQEEKQQALWTKTVPFARLRQMRARFATPEERCDKHASLALFHFFTAGNFNGGSNTQTSLQ